MKQNIAWLASYPKSGNTWLRIFIANYLANNKEPLPINQAYRFTIGDAMLPLYNKAAGGSLNPNDIPRTLQLRDSVLRNIAANGADINLVKTHSKRVEAQGVSLIPKAYTRSAIYIMRNPLDMMLSYARHYNLTHEQAAIAICHKDNALSPDHKTVVQFLGPWSEHVESWTGTSPYPVLVLRYEDILQDPEAQFAKVVEHLGIDVDLERLKRAIGHSSFGELKKQEETSGFIERPSKSPAFFASGKSGVWKDELDAGLIRQIRQNNKRVMKKYGYWNE